MGEIRTFDTGATRDTDEGKHDYYGYRSSLVTKRFGEYMTKHRQQPDGSMRGSDNWKKGLPAKESVRSLDRHVEDVKLFFEGYPLEAREGIEEALCAVIFNAQSILLEVLEGRTK